MGSQFMELIARMEVHEDLSRASCHWCKGTPRKLLLIPGPLGVFWDYSS